MDYIEKEFDYKGYHCVVTLNEIGYRCGYVQIKEGHPLYDKRFTDINDNYTLCMKLSYAGTMFPFNDDRYWIAFTCDRNGDKPDIQRVKEIWGEKPMVLTLLNMQKIPIIPRNGTIRTTEYVEDRLIQLVDEVDKL